MNKNKYQALCEEIKSKVKPGSTRASRSDLVDLAQTMLNTPEHEVTVYIKGADKKPTTVTVTPAKDYRESLKTTLIKDFGVDKDEAEKIMTIPFNKKHAAALIDVATHVIKDNMDVGRKFIFPITAKNEAQMEIAQVRVPEKVIEVAKITQGPDGTYTRELTGKRRKTAEHAAIQAKNKVPGWIVSDL